MAQSRLEKIGTIYTRVSGLLSSNAMKPVDKPIWYDLYEAFPPKLEPRFDRPAPKDSPIRKIFYAEDLPRAKFHKSLKHQEMVNLLDKKRETQAQKFIKIYQNLKNEGALDEEKIFETSIEVLQQQREQMKVDNQELIHDNSEGSSNPTFSLTEAFSKAKEATSKRDTNTESKSESSEPKNSIGGIDIKHLFKD